MRLGFSHLSKHKLKHNFADSLNPLSSYSLETESTLHSFLCCQNYTTLHRTLLTDLKNINNDIMSLNESDLFHVLLDGNKNFDNNMNISILTAIIKFIKDTERVLKVVNVIKTILISSSIPFLIVFFQEICCITTGIFALISYIFHLIVYKWSARGIIFVLYCFIYIYPFLFLF